MRPETPETDALVASINSDAHDFAEMTWLARRLERERDEARAALENNRKATEMMELMVYEEREKSAKLRDIAERAINALTAAWGYAEATKMLRAELDQLKEGGK